MWSSDGIKEYTLSEVECAQRGTTIELHLKEGEDEFLQSWQLKELIKRYANHVRIPVLMKAEALPGEAEENSDKDAGTQTELDYENVNTASALWTRPRREISDDEYKEFFKGLGHTEDPLAWQHSHVEGRLDYRILQFFAHKLFDTGTVNLQWG